MPPLEKLLEQACSANAGEVLIMAGDIPAMHVDGVWRRCAQSRCSPADVESLVKHILPAAEAAGHWISLEGQREVEFEHVSDAAGTIRCNAHFQRGSLVLLMRLPDQPVIHSRQ